MLPRPNIVQYVHNLDSKPKVDGGSVFQLSSDPSKRRSRLLAPTETPVEPAGISHRCVFTFHVDKSYRERLKDTVVDSPGVRKTLSKPFKL